MKNIGIYFSREPYDDGSLYVTSRHPQTQFKDYIHELADVFSRHGYRLVLLCKESSYIGAGRFSHYWLPDNTRKGYFVKKNSPVTVKTVYDKGHFTKNEGGLRLVNSLELSRLGRNKYAQYELFREFQPTTHLLHGKDGTATLNDTTTYVVKPLDLNGGRGIYRATGSELKSSTPEDMVLAQEFIESAAGYGDLVTTRHDIRLYMLNNQAHLMSIRQPEGDGFLSNTSRGGTIRFFDTASIPNELKKAAAQIDAKLARYGSRYYSADWMYDGRRWWLIEVNDRPGIPALCQDTDGETVRFQDEIVRFLIREDEAA